jgi:hypothetical protein
MSLLLFTGSGWFFFFSLERAISFLLSANRRLIHSSSLVNRLFNIEPLDFHWSNWRSCE